MENIWQSFLKKKKIKEIYFWEESKLTPAVKYN